MDSETLREIDIKTLNDEKLDKSLLFVIVWMSSCIKYARKDEVDRQTVTGGSIQVSRIAGLIFSGPYSLLVLNWERVEVKSFEEIKIFRISGWEKQE